MNHTSYTRRHTAVTVITTALLGAVASFYLGKTWRIHIVNAQSQVAAFYLERTLYEPDNVGRSTAFKIEVVARKSDGTTARMESLGPLTAAQHVRKLMFVDGRSVTIFDGIRVKNTFPPGPRVDVSQLGPSRPECGAPPGDLLRMDTISGMQVAVIQSSIPGRYRLTRWAAPAVACEALYYTSETLKADGSVAYMSVEAKPTKFVLGEPDPSIFDARVDFAELPPSEALKRLVTTLGKPLSEVEQARIDAEGQQLDRRYYQK